MITNQGVQEHTLFSLKAMSVTSAISKLRKLPDIQIRYNPFNYINQDAATQLQDNDDPLRPLNNLLVAVKDNIVTKGMPTTCSSKILEGYMSPFDATVIELMKKNGAVIAGKTNMDEFGMGSTGAYSHFGPAFNPLFSEKDKILPGGSSSGSAVAVASEVADFALGTDTGGSVRLPASFTSLYGFKPSYGRISRYGVIAYAQSLDTVGILSKDMKIVEKVFHLIDQFDPKDPTSLSNELRSKVPQRSEGKDKLKVGIPEEFNQNNVPAEFKAMLALVIKRLIREGHEVYPVSVPSVKNALSIYYTLAPAEAVSNLSRYDGVRYGYRDPESDIKDGTLFTPTRSKFGPEVQKRILLGNYNLCSEAFKNNYIKAQQLRVQLINDFDKVFRGYNALTLNKPNKEGVDILIGLTSMSLPDNLERFVEKEKKSPLNSYINDIFTMPMSLAGLPALSVPIGSGFGLQIFSQFGHDWEVLNAHSKIYSPVNK